MIKPSLDWIPQGRLLGIEYLHGSFPILCACLLLPIALCAWRRWARLVDAPWVFALLYGIPFFALNFQDSLGDTHQVMDYVTQRYYMSEPGATAIHYWFYRLLRDPFNLSAKAVIALTSSIAGVIYLWLTAKISFVLLPDADARRRLLFRLVYFAAGSSLLFYGYVENPPIAMPGEQAWVLATLIFLRTPSMRNNAMCGVALAIATLMHGRAAFLAPALLVGGLIPAAPLSRRFLSATIGGAAFGLTLALVVGGIFLFDPDGVMQNRVGNILGGGNRRMFVEGFRFFSESHWRELWCILWVSAGVTAPVILVGLISVFRRSRPSYLIWAMSYIAAGMVYVSIWEFDYGFFTDWDLLFSGAGGITFLSAALLASSRIPVPLMLPFVGSSLVVSMACATVFNGGPLGLNVAPKATYNEPQPQCAAGGLSRTYFLDRDLNEPFGIKTTEIAKGEWNTANQSHPNSGKPFGARYSGYARVPAAGRYRFYLQAAGNLRFRLANVTLYERWTGFEWQINSEREMYFPRGGWYPFQAELYSTLMDFKFKVEIESSTAQRHVLGADELCS